MNGNPFAVTPGGNMTEGLAGIGDVLKDIGDQKREREEFDRVETEKKQTQAAVTQALRPREDGTFDLDLVNKTAVEHREFANMIYTGMNATKEDQKQRLLPHMRELATAKEEEIPTVWQKRIDEGEAAGRDMTESRRELQEYTADPKGMKQAYELSYAAAADPQEFQTWKASREKAAPLTGIAKARQDLENGLITDAEFQEEVSRENPAHASAATKILSNGTVIQAFSDKTTQVTGPDGNVLEGPARTEALLQAQQDEIDFIQGKSGARTAGSEAIKQSTELFEKILPIRKSMDNYDLAIDALDRGANTGVIYSKFPSFKSASIELDNIQKGIGLDVVGTTTFGALSKGELDLALDRALPTKLDPADLRKFLVDKKAAQEKLATYLEDAAMYLGIPGNTVSSWIKEQREIEKLRQAPDGTPFTEMSDDDLLGGFGD